MLSCVWLCDLLNGSPRVSSVRGIFQSRIMEWNKARVGCFKRTAWKHVYYLGWNRSPAQVGCMRQVLGPGALGKPRGNGWRARWEGGLGWGTHVNPWLFHFNVWQNSLQIKIKEKKSINSLAFSLLYGPTLTFIHDYWKKPMLWLDGAFVSNVSSF